MLKNRKVIGMIIFTMVSLLLIIYIGPIDRFRHEYFVDETDCKRIAEEDFLDQIDLGTGDFNMRFSPKKHIWKGLKSILGISQRGILAI